MFAVVAAHLALSTCSEASFDDVFGKKVTVSYRVTLPSELATRYGEGTQMKNLYYVVYEAGTKNVIYNETVTGAFNYTTCDYRHTDLCKLQHNSKRSGKVNP